MTVIARPRDRSWRSFAATLALVAAAVALFALSQHLVDLAAFAQHGAQRRTPALPLMGRAFFLALPYPVVDPGFGPPRWAHLALIATACAESAVLYGLYRALRARAIDMPQRAVLAVGALAMVVAALRAHAVLGMDLYAYAGFARLGVPAAYATPATPFTGDFGAVNAMWGLPMLPSPYGPLWVWIAHLAAGGAGSLSGALVALRVLALVPFAAVALLLLRLRGLAFAALFALNPGTVMLYLANGHNDLLAVAGVLGALCAVPALPLLAAVLVAAAGLVKLPYAACALLVFAGRGDLARRVAWAALSVALVVLGSLVFGGAEYVTHLTARVGADAATGLNALTSRTIRFGLAALAITGLLTAFLRGTIWRNVAWSLVASSSAVYPWYLAGAIPYAVLERGALAAFLILFPLASALLEFAFPHVGLGQLAMLAMLVAGAYEIARKKSRPIDLQIVRPGP
jgi:hypothetical protein